MKLMLYAVIIFLLILVFSCKTNQDYTPDTYEKEQIVFGTSGGFAGHTTTYCLLSNGQFFYKAPRTESYKAIPSLEKSTTDQVFHNYNNLALAQLDLNDPGNLSYFLEMKQLKDTSYLTWGGNNIEVPENLRIFFTNLIRLAKKQNEKFRDENAVVK